MKRYNMFKVDVGSFGIVTVMTIFVLCLMGFWKLTEMLFSYLDILSYFM